jgi:hypothetical protein
LLLKNKAINKRFFYGVTATLIYYALDPDRNRKVPADSDEFFILNTDSKYIAMSEVKKKTQIKSTATLFCAFLNAQIIAGVQQNVKQEQQLHFRALAEQSENFIRQKQLGFHPLRRGRRCSRKGLSRIIRKIAHEI